MKMRKKYIIFDFDGTLVNTNDIIVDSWNATFEHYLGHTIPEKEILATFGEILVHTVAEKIPGVDVIEARDFYRDYQNNHCRGKIYVFDGIMELLTVLRERGYKTGVATSRTTDTFRAYMNELGLDRYVDEIVAMEDVTKHKPDPESINKILEKFGAEPEEAIMLGDTKFDIGCANNAGVDSVLVGWSHWVDMESMEADGFRPTYIIDRPEQLLELI